MIRYISFSWRGSYKHDQSPTGRKRQNVTVANGFCRFPNNHVIPKPAYGASAVCTLPQHGWPLEMHGFPVVFNGIWLSLGMCEGVILPRLMFEMLIKCGNAALANGI